MHPPRPSLYPLVRLDLSFIPPLSTFYIPPTSQFIPPVTLRLITHRPPCPHPPVYARIPQSYSPSNLGSTPSKSGSGCGCRGNSRVPLDARSLPPTQLQSHSPGETTDVVGGAEGSLYPLSHGTLPANPPVGGGNASRGEALPPPLGTSSGAGSVARGGGGVFNLPLRSAVGAARPGRLPVASRAGAEDAPWGPAARAGARRGLRGG